MWYTQRFDRNDDEIPHGTKIPTELRAIIGEVELSNDDRLSIGEQIAKGTCLVASNGGMIQTFQEVQGGYVYVIGGDKVSNVDIMKGT